MSVGNIEEEKKKSLNLKDVIAAICASSAFAAIITGMIFRGVYVSKEKQIALFQADKQRLSEKYVLREGNVIGGDANDTYYEPCCNRPLCGRPRGDVTIDGNSIEHYFQKQPAK